MRDEPTSPSSASVEPQRNARADLKTVLMVVGVIVAVAGATAALLSTVYQTRVEAGEHEQVFVEHVGYFRAHAEQDKARARFLEDLRTELSEQRAMLRTVNDNQIRLMERLRVQPVRSPP